MRGGGAAAGGDTLRVQPVTSLPSLHWRASTSIVVLKGTATRLMKLPGNVRRGPRPACRATIALRSLRLSGAAHLHVGARSPGPDSGQANRIFQVDKPKNRNKKKLQTQTTNANYKRKK